jgi:hypothetical protein
MKPGIMPIELSQAEVPETKETAQTQQKSVQTLQLHDAPTDSPEVELYDNVACTD